LNGLPFSSSFVLNQYSFEYLLYFFRENPENYSIHPSLRAGYSQVAVDRITKQQICERAYLRARPFSDKLVFVIRHSVKGYEWEAF
jgi:hypothetical protein